MAQGTVVFFDDALLDIAEGLMDLETGTYLLALVTATAPPVITTAVPHWGGTGTTNLKTNEVTPGGNYATNGKALANPTVTNNSGTIEIDMDDPATWAQNVGNPTNATWGVIYEDGVNKHALGFVDLGGAFDMTTGDLSVSWGAPMATLNQA